MAAACITAVCVAGVGMHQQEGAFSAKHIAAYQLCGMLCLLSLKRGLVIAHDTLNELYHPFRLLGRVLQHAQTCEAVTGVLAEDAHYAR